MKTRIVFFGTPNLSVPFLASFIESDAYEVVGVVTQPKKPVGRKAVLTASPIQIFAESKNIPVFEFTSLKKPETETQLTSLSADIYLVVVYGKLIPKNILDLPRLGCVNVHPSLLPAYRGPTPYQQAILNGEKETGISIMLLDEGMDTGPVLATTKFTLDTQETSETIQEKIITHGVPLFFETVEKWINGAISPVAQSSEGASVCGLLKKEDALIDWNQEASVIERKIRAFTPWPGTYFYWTEKDRPVRVSILRARVYLPTNSTDKSAVMVEDHRVFMRCGNNTFLELLEVKPDGKSAMDAMAYVRGHQDFLQVKTLSSQET